MKNIKGPRLLVSNNKIALIDESTSYNPLYVDFSSNKILYKLKTSYSLPLIKAIGCKGKKLTILDATSGLGTDGFILASLGHKVTMCEREQIIYQLLQNGLQRAMASSNLHKPLNNIQLHFNDFRQVIKKQSKFDVIYLDPMFPEKNKSALVKKEMQLLQKLTQQPDDIEKLISFSQQLANKVVVKRPRHASIGLKANHQIIGKTTKFLIYISAH